MTDIAPMPKGNGRAYPKVIAGEGRGILDDMPSFELMEIIKKIDKTGESDFVITNEYGREMVWDYRNYRLDCDQALIKGEVEAIRRGYEEPEDY